MNVWHWPHIYIMLTFFFILLLCVLFEKNLYSYTYIFILYYILYYIRICSLILVYFDINIIKCVYILHVKWIAFLQFLKYKFCKLFFHVCYLHFICISLFIQIIHIYKYIISIFIYIIYIHSCRICVYIILNCITQIFISLNW